MISTRRFSYKYVWAVERRTIAVAFCSLLFNSQGVHSYLKYLSFSSPQKKGARRICILKNKQNWPHLLGLTRFKSKRQRKRKQRKVLLWRPRKQMFIRAQTHRWLSESTYLNMLSQTAQPNQILKAQRMRTEEQPVLLKHGFEFCDRDRGVGVPAIAQSVC